MVDIYAVQALIPDLGARGPAWARDEWRDVYVADGQDSGMENLTVARAEQDMARRFYINVRIVRRPDAGEDVVVK